MEQGYVFVTEDNFLRDGKRHPVDDKVVPPNARIVNSVEALKIISTETEEHTVSHMSDKPEEIADPEEVWEDGVPLTQEMIDDLRDKAMKGLLADPDDDWGITVTLNEAEYIRKLRVEERGTWRYVAAKCSERWNGEWGSNQIAGMSLCKRAAVFFEEDFMSPPWN